MRIKIKTNEEVEVCRLYVSAGVRYWQDSKIDGIRDNDCDDEEEKSPMMPCVSYIENSVVYLRAQYWRWCPIINVDNGKIENWEIGKTADIHYKVCDDFMCDICDSNGEDVESYFNYVPQIMCPAGEGYGDYIIMHIDENGFIENWNKDLIYELFED